MAMVTAGAIGDPPPAQYTGCHAHGEELYVPGILLTHTIRYVYASSY